MATIKAYTDLEQSKKLVEILPLESADMFWLVLGNTPRVHVLTEPLSNYSQWESYPCWSLAALLEEIPYEICDDDGNSAFLSMYKENDNYQLVYESASDDFDDIETDVHEDFVDACVEMIFHLNDNNLL